MTRHELFAVGSRHPALMPYHYKECGLDNIYLANGFTIEDMDGDDYVSIENVDGLWKAIGLNLVRDQKTFAPKEIRFLRTQMEMTQAELALLLRVDDQTVARWEKQKCKIPGPADLALRVLFLSSTIAQPEGGELLKHLHEAVRAIVEKDDTAVDDLLFVQRDHHWYAQRGVAVA